MTDEEAIELARQIEDDAAAEAHAHKVANARRKVVALALNLESLYLIHTVQGVDSTTTVPDGYLETAHEPLDQAVRELADLLAGE